MRRGTGCPKAGHVPRYCREREDGDLELLPMGTLVRSDAAPSLRSWAILVGRLAGVGPPPSLPGLLGRKGVNGLVHPYLVYYAQGLGLPSL
jgi:hypothetical protein